VIVVDNGSTDNSVAMARQSGAVVLCLGQNHGVSRALNQGIRASRGEWIALVNNDVELDPDWLACLCGALRDGPAGFATGKVLSHGDRQRVDGAGDAVCRGGTAWRLGHGKLDGPVFNRRRPTSFPSATAGLFRREFFERVGLFEEGFFAYLEDVDLGFRAALAGCEGIYVPEAIAYHRGSETTGIWNAKVVEWMTCHQLLLLAKFYPAALLWRCRRSILAAQFLWALLAMTRGRGLAWALGFARGVGRFARFRRISRSLREGTRPLDTMLHAAEGEIAQVQQETGWDTYWKWYFRLAPLPSGARPS
jgi:GT2 family glycosyltransferase